jgi:putative transposase
VSTLSHEQRALLVEREGGEIPLTQQVELLSISRSSVSYQPKEPSPEEIAIKHRIDELYTQYPFYGSRRIAEQMKREGVVINRKAVQRHMREMGSVAIYPGPNLSRRQHKEHVFPYLLRNLTISAPNHVWGLDITYIRMQKGWMYLVAVLDWYSRFVISWELDHTLEMPFVLSAVENALSTAVPVIWNSDQGSHFTSPQYLQLLQNARVKMSMVSYGRALDNIFTERLWRTVKYEEVYLHDYTSPKEARQQLTKYFQFYNYKRVHQALDDQTPAELYSTVTPVIPA